MSGTGQFRFLYRSVSNPHGDKFVDGVPTSIAAYCDRSRVTMRLVGRIAPYSPMCYVEVRPGATKLLYAIVANGKASTYVFEGRAGLRDAEICEGLSRASHEHILCQVGEIDERYITDTVNNLQVVIARHELHRTWLNITQLGDPFISHIGNQIREMNELLSRFAEDDEQLGETYVDGNSGTSYYEGHALVDAATASSIDVPQGLYAMISIIVDDSHNGVPDDMSRHFTALRFDGNTWVAARRANATSTSTQGPPTLPTLVGLRPAEQLRNWRPNVLDILVETAYA